MEERLNNEAALFINEKVDDIMCQISDIVYKSKKFGYTEFNLAMNIITGCIVKMMHHTPDPLRDEFIQHTLRNLADNLENLRNKGL